MRKAGRLILLTILLTWCCFSMNTRAASSAELNNPVSKTDNSMEAGRKVTWDCIKLGSYPQTEIVDKATTCGTYTKTWGTPLDYEINPTTYSTLKKATGWDSHGDIKINGVKYRRIKKSEAGNTAYGGDEMQYTWSDASTYHYFRYEPIVWRVLNIEGDRALLLADKVLDCRPYNTVNTNITWAQSTLRSWLNGYGASYNKAGQNYNSNNFINDAFSTEEKTIIQKTPLDNKTSGYYAPKFGGEDTEDLVFLLSENDIAHTDVAESYGFIQDTSNDEGRKCSGGTYAKAMGLYMDTSREHFDPCTWWLRSPGLKASTASHIRCQGYMYDWGSVWFTDYGVRPAITADLSDESLWTYAGTVCSDAMRAEEIDETEGDVEEIEFIPASELTMMEFEEGLDEYSLHERYESLGGTPYREGAMLVVKYSSGTKTYTFHKSTNTFVCGNKELTVTPRGGIKANITYRIDPQDVTMIFTFRGVESNRVPIRLTDNPVKEFRMELAQPVTMREGKDFIWYEEYNYGEVLRPEKIINENAALIVTGPDGSEKRYLYDTSSQYFKNGTSRYYVYVYLDKRDGIYTFVAHCNYKQAVIPIAVKGNSVRSISYTPAEPIELTIDKDLATEDMDHRLFDMGTREGAGSYGFFCRQGDQLTVDYDGLGTKEYIYDEDNRSFINPEDEDDEILKRDIYWSFKVPNGLFVAGPDYLNVTYSNRAAEVPFTVLENPVESISFEPAGTGIELMENVDVRWHEEDGVRYSVDVDSIDTEKIFAPGSKLILKLQDGQKEYIFNADEGAFLHNDERIEPGQILYTPLDYGTARWTVGSDTNPLSLKYYGRSTTVDVRIIPYNQAIADRKAAAAVTKKVDNLPDTEAFDQGSSEDALIANLAAEYDVVNTVKAYNALTEAQKGLVEQNLNGASASSSSNHPLQRIRGMLFSKATAADNKQISKLFQAESLVKEAASRFEGLETEQKKELARKVLAIMDHPQKKIIYGVSYDVKAIPDNVDEIEDYSVQKIKEDYSRLSSVGKFIVNNKTRNLAKLKAAEVIVMIKGLPAKITLNDEKAVLAARKAYDLLTADQKEYVEDIYSRLTAAEASIKTAKEKADGSSQNTGTARKAVKVKKIKLTGISKKIARGKKIKLTATVLPVKATNKKLTWTSSNKKLATVTRTGWVKIAKKAKPGKTVTITAKAKDGSGKKQIYKIKIMKGAVKKITVKGYKKTLKAGKTMKLNAVVKATKGKPVNKKLLWTSSKPKWATVTQTGKVKALPAGKGKTVKIQVMSTDGTNRKVVKKIRIN